MEQEEKVLFNTVSTKLLTNEDRALFNKAIAHFNLEEYQQALEILKNLALKLASPRVLLNYGYLLYLHEHYKEALKVFRHIIELNPYFIEAYLNAFKTCLALNDIPQARKYCDGAYRLAPHRHDVIQAKALFYFETDEIELFLRTMGTTIPTHQQGALKEEELQKIKDNASILIGNKKISAMITVFANTGLRSILIGYRDVNNTLKKPTCTYKWHPLRQLEKEAIAIEPLTIDEEVGMIGYRVNGLEQTENEQEEILGFLVAEFQFEQLEEQHKDDFAGIMLVDADKQMRTAPKKVHVHELLAFPEGDLVDLYQDMLFPKANYTMSQNTNAPKVFLSFASEDYSIAEHVFKTLRKSGIDAWKHDESLIIGDDYDDKIDEAIKTSDFAIVFLSATSVNKVGYVSKEFRKILDAAKHRPLGFPFALPLKIDDCEVPKAFAKFHWLEITNNQEEITQGLVQQIKEQYQVITKTDNTRH